MSNSLCTSFPGVLKSNVPLAAEWYDQKKYIETAFKPLALYFWIWQTFVVKFATEDEHALTLDGQAVFIPGDIGRQAVICGSAAEDEGQQEEKAV
jgi:hypothetical protein